MYSSTTLLDIPVLYMYNCEKNPNSFILFVWGGGGCSSTKLNIRESREIFERGCRAAGGCRTYSSLVTTVNE